MGTTISPPPSVSVGAHDHKRAAREEAGSSYAYHIAEKEGFQYDGRTDDEGTGRSRNMTLRLYFTLHEEIYALCREV
jgi:hypothetical protein